MDFSFFTTNNKSGHKTKEVWFSKNHPEEYVAIINYSDLVLPKESTFKEKIWVYYHKLSGRPKCSGCDNHVKFSERFDRGYGSFCSLECANNNQDLMLDKIKESNQKKWGVDFYTQHKDFVTKQKRTKKEKYGNENYNNSQKMKTTKKLLYGSDTYNNSEKNKITRRDSFISLVNEKTKDTFISYELDSENITLQCQFCGQQYEIYNNLFNYRVKQKSILCTKCNLTEDKQTSGLEKDLSNFVSSLEKIVTKDRSLLDGKEVDLLVPNKLLGIEFNGLYWHSELYIDKDYHLNKTLKANSKGFDLIHIFEDEWLEKPEIVKSIIKNKLGIKERVIYGRKCKINLLDKDTEIDFLNKNHIQGFVGSNVCYGLYFNDELVSLMSFGGLRKSLGHKKEEGVYEMLRFCNKLDTKVLGGASKLFKYFLKNNSPKRVITYSDRRYFNGELYQTLGFNNNGVTKPNYFYTIKHSRFNRYKYRKDVLVKESFDPNKTEEQIMRERGYLRIWDCGNVRWEYTT